MEKKLKSLQLKPCGTKELARLYDVKPRIIRVWLEPFISLIGERNGRYYTIKQVAIIFEKLGEPNREISAA